MLRRRLCELQLCTPAGPARCAFETAPVAFPRPEGVRGNAPSPARTGRTAAPKAVHDCGLGRIGLFSQTYNHLRLDLVDLGGVMGLRLIYFWIRYEIPTPEYGSSVKILVIFTLGVRLLGTLLT